MRGLLVSSSRVLSWLITLTMFFSLIVVPYDVKAADGDKHTVTGATDSTKPVYVELAAEKTIPAGTWGANSPSVDLTQYKVTVYNNSQTTISDWKVTIETSDASSWNAGWNGATRADGSNTITIGTVKSDGDSGVWQNNVIKAGDTATGSGFQIAASAINGATVTIEYTEGEGTGEVSEDTSGGGNSSGGGSTYDGSNIGSIDTSKNYNFAKLLQLSLYFYDANMCGEGVEANSLCSKTNNGGNGWRGNCHVNDSFSYDGKTYKVTGGYHDAGDHVKFGLPAAQAFTGLGLGYMEFKEAYNELGQTGHFKNILDYYCDYIRKCTVIGDDGKVKAFCYQVGHGDPDHAKWDSPEVEDENATDRKYTLVATSSNPATDIVGETAAALAANYINFGDEKDLEYAEALFEFARVNTKGIGEKDGTFYASSSWDDDYCLAAALLYKATKKEIYKTEYNSNKSNLANKSSEPFGWDNTYQAAVLYAPEKSANDIQKLQSYLNGYANKSQNSYYCHDSWGSARINCNIQLMMMIFDKYNNTDTYTTWCRYQMSLILGGNSTGKNLVCGYNGDSPVKPHHRAASGYGGWDGFNANADQKYTLYGALVGGPSDSNFSSYKDVVNDAVSNEVTLDYNAGMVGAAAALYLKYKDSTDAGFNEQTILADFYSETGASEQPSESLTKKTSFDDQSYGNASESKKTTIANEGSASDDGKNLIITSENETGNSSETKKPDDSKKIEDTSKTVEPVKVEETTAFNEEKKLEESKTTSSEKIEDKSSDTTKNKKSLTVLKIGDNVKVIKKNAFKGYTALKTIIIGKNVRTIEAGAFSGCKSVTKIIIKSKKIKRIGSKAFKGVGAKKYSSLKVTVPKKKLTLYKMILRKAGLSKKAKVKK